MIVGSVRKFKEDIAEIQKKIDAIQEKCSHPKEALEIQNKVGGEFDNHYFRYCFCHLCEKRWTEDQ